MPTFLGRRVPTSAIVSQAPRPYTTPPVSMGGGGTTAPTGDLAKSIAGLGTLFSNGTQRALQQEQLTALGDKNELTRMVASSIGADGLISNPQNFAIAAGLGAADASRVARTNAVVGYGRDGPGSVMGTNALYALGEGNKTQKYFDEDFANKVTMQGMQEATKLRMNDAQEATKLRLADNALATIDTPEGPRYVRTGEAPGQRPVLSTDQVKAGVLGGLLPDMSLNQKNIVAGVAPMTPELYVGTTASGTAPVTPKAGGGFINAQTGEDITEPMSSVGKLVASSNDGLKPTDEPNRVLRDAQIGTTQAINAINRLKGDLAKPNAGASLGAVGSVASSLNYIRAQTEAAAKALNPKSLGYADEIGAEEVSKTIDNAFRNNSALLSKAQSFSIDHAVLRSQIQNLAYVIAKANDSQGRVSAQDAQSAIDQIGGSLGDPVAMSAVLDNLGNNLAAQYDAKDQVFRRMYGDKIAVPRREGSAASAAPAAAEAAPAAGGNASALRQKYGLE